MKVTRTYASPEQAVNVKELLQQLVKIELDKLVNTNPNPPAPHDKITSGGDCA